MRKTQNMSLTSQESRVLSPSDSQWLDEEHREGTNSAHFSLRFVHASHFGKELE